jgi:hypothetical protein
MSFIQKLIERKTQKTGSDASRHVVEDDLTAQETDLETQEHVTEMVDFVDLDAPDAPAQVDDPSDEPADNIHNLVDPFDLDDDDEMGENIDDLPDLDADLTEEIATAPEMSKAADQVNEAAAPGQDDVSVDDCFDIDDDDEVFNIWDVDMDGEAVEAEASEPEETPMQRVQSVTPIHENIRPQQPKISPEIAEEKPQEPVAFAPAIAPAAPQVPERRRAGRVKTRLIGFDHASKPGVDLFESVTIPPKTAQASFPVGWLVVVDGPGFGESFALHAGMSQIGRGEDQTIPLDFGDAAISRNNHAAIVYDVETHTFLMGHGGKANVVRLNGKPLICTEEVKNADLIRIGETTLRLVVFCDSEFNWENQVSKGPNDAENA